MFTTAPIVQTCDTTLEEFLEELDALTDPEAEESKASPQEADSDAQRKTEATPPRSSEKRVRFSEEPCLAKSSENPQAGCVDSLKASKQEPRPSGDDAPDPELPAAAAAAAVEQQQQQQQPSYTECTRTDSGDRSAGPPSASPDKAKCGVSSANAGARSGL